MVLMFKEYDDQDPYNLTFGGSDDQSPNNWHKYHDLWDSVLNGLRAPWAGVVKRPDSIYLTKTKWTFLKRENL